MVVPAILFILVFSYFPMYGILLAFKNYDIFQGFWASPWAGFENFNLFFTAPEFRNIMRNTIALSFLKLVIGFPAPILLAILLNEIRHMAYKRLIQTISYLPHFLSWVIVSTFVASMLSTENGSINMLLVKLHLIDEPINFLSLPQYFWGIIVASNVWKEIGFSSIVYLAAIAGINPQLYEAASVDGASRMRQIITITIPSILPVATIFFILAVGGLLNAGFEDLLLLGGAGTVQDVSQVIDTYVYKYGIQSNRFSYATAVGLFKSAISVSLLVFANWFARRSGNSLW
jgi:putative aldouronate transport system permease protein